MIAIEQCGLEDVPLVGLGDPMHIHYEREGRVCFVFCNAKCTVYYFCRFCSSNYANLEKAERCEDQHRREFEKRFDLADSGRLSPR